MKNLGLFILSSLTLASASTILSAVPTFYFEYSFLLDRRFCELSGSSVDPELIKTLRQNLPHYQQLWNQQGPALLAELYQTLEASTCHTEFTVNLVLFKETISFSNPLTLNMHYIMLNPSNSERDQSFIDAVFIIYIFNLLNEHCKLAPTLTTQFSELNYINGQMIYPLALCSTIYKKLQRTDFLCYLEQTYGSIPAWQVIQEIGDEKLVGQLVQYLHSTKQHNS